MITEHWGEFLVLYSRFSLVFYFIHISKYVSPDLPTHGTPPSPLGMHKFVPYICVSISASQINSSVSLFLDSRYNHWLLSGWVPKRQESCGTVSREWITDGSPLPSYLAVSDSSQLPCQHWLLQHPLWTPPGCTPPQRLPRTPHTQKAALEGTSVLTTLVQAAGPLPWGLSSPFPSFKVSCYHFQNIFILYVCRFLCILHIDCLSCLTGM